jgi:hypothetical protein
MPRRSKLRILRLSLSLLIGILLCRESEGYSVLTHQEIIDSSWDRSIEPLLRKRFPGSTPDSLREAHSYAYGGSIIQDAGYYPFGRRLFTNLLHYVRSGDFIEALLDESRDLNEYAFALGALAHYAADNRGHPLAINPSVPIIYPELRRKFGHVAFYADSPSKHLKVEFAFDVLQVARGNYSPDSYKNLIGFRVSKPVLERAFKRVYCLEMADLFASVDLALGTYRHAVGTIIPRMTKVAWQYKRKEIQELTPGMTADRFVFRLSRREYERTWGDKYEKPGFCSRVFALMLRILPKVGFLKPLSFRLPDAEAERLFLASLQQTKDLYAKLLRDVARGRLDLRNTDFDTGRPTRPGEYRPADETYCELLRELAERDFRGLTAALRADFQRFYSDLNAPFKVDKNRKEWRETLAALQMLRTHTGEIPERSSR